MKPKAFLLDLDGVITDTARYHYLAWKQLCEAHGFSFREADNERLKGVSRRRSLEIILELNGRVGAYSEEALQVMEKEKNDSYRHLLRGITHADILPGISAFLAQARSEGIQLAVASASRNAPEVLERLGLNERFDYVADAARAGRPKPYPDIFLCCSNALGRRPEECIGIEDAPAGIQAIHAAGMLSVGIGVLRSSVKPDIPLASTHELTLARILAVAAPF